MENFKKTIYSIKSNDNSDYNTSYIDFNQTFPIHNQNNYYNNYELNLDDISLSFQREASRYSYSLSIDRS